MIYLFSPFIPFSHYGLNGRYNLDGFLTYSKAVDDGKARSYVQLYRNGIFEAVNSSLLERLDLKILPVIFEEDTMSAFRHYISRLKDLNVGLPIFAFLTLVGVKGYSMACPQSWIFRGDTIEKDVLLLPEIVIENFDFEVDNILKPWLDAVWNACGFSCSQYYDSSDKWIGRP